MPILSVKRIINAPNVTSTLPGLWPVQLKSFGVSPRVEHHKHVSEIAVIEN